MATLPETSAWTEGVYQIETSDPVLGGPDGISNQQAKDLANRTAYLKEQIEGHLNVDNVDDGTLDVTYGGTGRNELTSDRYLIGNGTGPVKLLTPAEVMANLSVIPFFTAIPEYNITPVIHVVGLGEMWWTETAYFTGYRSPLCGMWMDGWTPTPLPFQIEAIGGTWRESDEKERRVIARYRESGLVVPIGSWIKGQNMISDLGGGNWKSPDLRDMFKRMTGTDVDTANARGLGQYQADALQNIVGDASFGFNNRTQVFNASGVFSSKNSTTVSAGPSGSQSGHYTLSIDTSKVVRASSETRSASSAVAPFIHV